MLLSCLFQNWFAVFPNCLLKSSSNLFGHQKNLTVRDFYINGFENQKILVKEISPQLPNDFALLVLHGGGFGYKTAPHQLTNAFEYATKLNCKTYLVEERLKF